MKRMRIFGFRCLCFGLLAFLPLTVQAKEIKITVDAKDYKSGKDWKRFVERLWHKLSCSPHSDRPDCKFHLHILNGDIFGTEPPKLSDCFEAGNSRSLAEEIFGKVSALNIQSRKFSTRSLERLFTKATDIFLDGTETIEGTLPETCKLHVMLEVDPSKWEPPSSDRSLLLSRFVGVLFELLQRYPDDQRVIFELTVKNGDFFNCEPIVDYRSYLNKQESEQTKIVKILSRIKVLRVHTKHFSTLSLLKVFPWVEALILPDAECISGVSKETGLRISRDDFAKMNNIIGNPCPRLERVSAPKVTKIANAAFFGFRELRAVNAHPPSYGEERPAIVCTSLPENYFMQCAAPENTHIAPVTFRKALEYLDEEGQRQTEILRDGGKTVEIGACAFERCFSLQHVSAHVSMIGYAAFAASRLESVHLLLSESAIVGKDVFYNCFYLKECLMMSDQLKGEFKERFDGWFWNCFSLKTICMPNVQCCGFLPNGDVHSVRKYPLPINATVEPAPVFTNCFSLEELDLRCYTASYSNCLPCNILQLNHWKACGKDFRSSYYASFESGIPRKVSVDGCSDETKFYISLSCKEIEEVSAIPICTAEPWGPLCNIKTVIYDPKLLKSIACYSVPELYSFQPLVCTARVAAGPFSWSFENPKPLYDKNLPSSFQRFNDAYLKWFVYKENLSPEEEEIEEEEIREECKFSGRKTKRTNCQ